MSAKTGGGAEGIRLLSAGMPEAAGPRAVRCAGASGG